MNIDLSHFAPIKAETRSGGMWVRISGQVSMSIEATLALGNPSRVNVLYSEEDDAFLITAAEWPNEGYKVTASRQFRSVDTLVIAQKNGWQNRRYPAIMTDAGLLVRHHEEDTHHE